MKKIVVAVVCFIAVIAYSKYYNDQVELREKQKDVINACFVSIARVSRVPSTEAYINAYQNQFKKYSNAVSDRGDFKVYVDLCGSFYQVITDRIRDAAFLMDGYQSGRMRDVATVNSQKEFEWRLEILERLQTMTIQMKDESAFIAEMWREKLAVSPLTDEAKIAFYSIIKMSARRVAVNVGRELTVTAIRRAVSNVRDYFIYMYDNKEADSTPKCITV